MFLKSIKEKIKSIEARLFNFNERLLDVEDRPQVDVKELKNETEERLLSFHKEITDKYFETLEKILRVHTESSIITALAHNIDQRNLDNLKSSLLKPFLEAKWENDRKEKGEKIINAGEEIIKTRDDLHNQMLLMEKRGEDISKIRIQVNTYDDIIAKITGGKS